MDGGVSRRSFLAKTAAVTATVGLIAAAPLSALRALSPARAATKPDELAPALSGPLVAYIRDASKGEVILMVGAKEVVRKDPGLVARLVRSCEA